MKVVFKTNRLRVIEATENDIPYIMGLEQHPENKKFVLQGTIEEHKNEITSDDYLLLIIKQKYEHIGFMLCHKDTQNSSFELRRMIIQSKGRGFGKEVLLGLMDYSLNRIHFNHFWLDVFEDNQHAIHLYETIGLKLASVKKTSIANKTINLKVYYQNRD